MTMTQAERAIQGACTVAEQQGKRMSVVVVDEAGHVVATRRMDGCPWLYYEVAQAKAVPAVGFQRETKVIGERIGSEGFWKSVPFLLAGRFCAGGGGVPVVRDGVFLGAIGVSGGSGDQDDACAHSGAESAA